MWCHLNMGAGIERAPSAQGPGAKPRTRLLQSGEGCTVGPQPLKLVYVTIGFFTKLSRMLSINSFLFHQIYISSSWFYRIFQAFLVLLPNKNNHLHLFQFCHSARNIFFPFFFFFSIKHFLFCSLHLEGSIINYREFRVKKPYFLGLGRVPDFQCCLTFLGFSFLKWNEGCLRWFHF